MIIYITFIYNKYYRMFFKLFLIQILILITNNKSSKSEFEII